MTPPLWWERLSFKMAHAPRLWWERLSFKMACMRSMTAYMRIRGLEKILIAIAIAIVI